LRVQRCAGLVTRGCGCHFWSLGGVDVVCGLKVELKLELKWSEVVYKEWSSCAAFTCHNVLPSRQLRTLAFVHLDTYLYLRLSLSLSFLIPQATNAHTAPHPFHPSRRGPSSTRGTSPTTYCPSDKFSTEASLEMPSSP
jgi:hypothetical protein